MPGPAHETLIALFEQRPGLLALALRTLGQPGLPDALVARSATLRAANPLEVRPDLLLLAEGERGPWVLLDVQRHRDDDKQRRWLAAVGVLLDTRGVMGDVVIVTHDASVAVWARVVACALGPGGTRIALEPIVLQLTLAEVERLLATELPELAVLAAWAVHDQRGREAQEVVRAAVDRIEAAADPELREALMRAMLSMLDEPLLDIVRETLMNPLMIPMSPGQKKLREEIGAPFEARGEARGEARALLTVLAARGLPVDAPTRERVEQCTDATLLNRWVARAVTAATLASVFDDTPDAE